MNNAIFTRFLSQTETLPPRYKAWTMRRNESLTLAFREGDVITAEVAARRLAQKLGWSGGHLFQVESPGVIIFVPCPHCPCDEHAPVDRE